MIDWKTGKRLREVSLYLTHRQAKYLLEFLEFAVRNPEVEDHTHIASRGLREQLGVQIMTSRKLREGEYSPEVRRLCRGWVDDPVRLRARKRKERNL